MRLIKPSYEIWEQEFGLEGIYKIIENVGRVCYKSEDKIAEGTAKAFVNRMIKLGHGAMLEHGTIYLAIPMTTGHSGMSELRYMDNEYSIVTESTGLSMKDELGNKCDCWCVTTNLRVLIENDWLEDTWYLCEPTEHHEKRITVKFICDRGVSHEYVRHRVFSFAQESTRYCNYAKDKFGNECTFIIPPWTGFKEGNYPITWDGLYGSCDTLVEYDSWFFWHLALAERDYFKLLEKGWIAQQARNVLPNSLKTELVMTGFVSDWEHFFKLRDASSAHPQARELAKPLHEEFIKRGFISK